MKPVYSLPDAERTFEALRNFGYDLNASIADIIDNSITPKVGSNNIIIKFNNIKGKFSLFIQDDGCGMSKNELEKAMQLGNRSSYIDGDLGKYGFGLKSKNFHF